MHSRRPIRGTFHVSKRVVMGRIRGRFTESMLLRDDTVLPALSPRAQRGTMTNERIGLGSRAAAQRHRARGFQDRQRSHARGRGGNRQVERCPLLADVPQVDSRALRDATSSWNASAVTPRTALCLRRSSPSCLRRVPGQWTTASRSARARSRYHARARHCPDSHMTARTPCGACHGRCRGVHEQGPREWLVTGAGDGVGLGTTHPWPPSIATSFSLSRFAT
jgi:hypothetical protein